MGIELIECGSKSLTEGGGSDLGRLYEISIHAIRKYALLWTLDRSRARSLCLARAHLDAQHFLATCGYIPELGDFENVQVYRCRDVLFAHAPSEELFTISEFWGKDFPIYSKAWDIGLRHTEIRDAGGNPEDSPTYAADSALLARVHASVDAVDALANHAAKKIRVPDLFYKFGDHVDSYTLFSDFFPRRLTDNYRWENTRDLCRGVLLNVSDLELPRRTLPLDRLVRDFVFMMQRRKCGGTPPHLT